MSKEKSNHVSTNDSKILYNKIISESLAKLEKLYDDLEIIYTVLSECNFPKKDIEDIDDIIINLKKVSSLAVKINDSTIGLATSIHKKH